MNSAIRSHWTILRLRNMKDFWRKNGPVWFDYKRRWGAMPQWPRPYIDFNLARGSLPGFLFRLWIWNQDALPSKQSWILRRPLHCLRRTKTPHRGCRERQPATISNRTVNLSPVSPFTPSSPHLHRDQKTLQLRSGIGSWASSSVLSKATQELC